MSWLDLPGTICPDCGRPRLLVRSLPDPAHPERDSVDLRLACHPEGGCVAKALENAITDGVIGAVRETERRAGVLLPPGRVWRLDWIRVEPTERG